MRLYARLKKAVKAKAHSLRWRREKAYTDAFLSEMHSKAASFGVTDAVWRTPSGMGTANQVSPKGLVQIAARSMRSSVLRDIWSCDSATIHVYGANEREIDVQHIMNYPPLRDSYQILGWKSGTWSGKERNYINCVMAVKGPKENQIMLGAVMDCTGNASDPDRYIALNELFDAASHGGLEQSDQTEAFVSHAGKACCGVFYTDRKDMCYPVNQNADLLSVPASTTKVLTCLLALDYLSLEEKVKILPFDLVRGSGQIFRSNDIVTVRDLLFAALLPSSNQAATALARCAGRCIVNHK